MEDLVLALRNIGRNRRRSVVTMLAVALSCGGLTLFGGYVSWTFRAVELQTLGIYGHVQVYKRGYYEHGSGDPASYALGNYEDIRKMLLEDPVLGPRIEFVTGQLVFNGLVTCEQTRKSSTFIGLGVVPSEDERLWHWNPYGISHAGLLEVNAHLFRGPSEMADDDPDSGSLGIGLGRILQLDRPRDEAERPGVTPAHGEARQGAGDGGVDLDFLTAESLRTAPETAERGQPSVELLVAPPSGGMPNVATLGVRKLMPRSTKELDDQLIKLPLGYASNLLFPGQPLHVTAVIVLLKRTDDTGFATARLQELISKEGLDLEFRRWFEIRPFYHQLKRMLGIIFVFVFILLAMLVAFTIYNTQSAGIIERMGELGTLRAIGVKRWGIWRMLVIEGVFLGVLGGLLGLGLGIAGDFLLRAVEVVYIPPGVSFHAKVEVLVLRDPFVMLIAFVGSLVCAILSSALPARRAAFTPIVEALRHT